MPVSPTEEELVTAQDFARRFRRDRLGVPFTATDAECEAAEAAEAAADAAEAAAEAELQ